MKIEVLYRPANSVAKVSLQPNEAITSEGGAMIAMSAGITVATTTHKRNQKGIGRAIKRLFAGENFFLNHFTASDAGGDLFLGTTMPGDMTVINLNNQQLIVQAGSFVAHEESVNMDVGWQGFKNLISRESLFWLKISGQGQVILSSFGAIYPVEVDGEYIVDTGHIVAFDETLNYTLSKAGKSWISSILGGEGLVCKFKGKGRIWCQSHHPHSFGWSMRSKLRPKRR